MTDANLLLGRLIPEYFPALFGPNRNEPLDRNATLVKFTELAETVCFSQKTNHYLKLIEIHVFFLKINQFLRENKQKTLTIEEIALGYIRVANESMSRPIRALTEVTNGLSKLKHTTFLNENSILGKGL